MASINVKNQDEFDKLSWQDKFKYTKENPNSVITNNEVLRVKNVLETNPSDSAKNYAAGLTALRSGESLENVLGDAFDKSKYGYQGVSDNFKRPIESAGSYDGDQSSTSAGTDMSTLNTQTNGIVAARDYINSVAGNRGGNYNIGFSNGFVTVNGKNLKPEYIKDGVAYIKKKDIDDTLSLIDYERGRDTNRGILNENEIKWAEDYYNALDKVRNREGFSYNKNEDPIYKEFEKFYLNRADKDAADIVANASANTYGLTNMGAIVAADALKKNRLEELAAYQKQFRDDAYSRYVDEINQDRTDLETVRQLRDEDLSRNYSIHRQDIDDERYNWEQDWRERQYQQAHDKTNLELDTLAKQKDYNNMALNVDYQKMTGHSMPWYREAYGGDIENPYYREDVEFDRGLKQADMEFKQALEQARAEAMLQNELNPARVTSSGGGGTKKSPSTKFETKKNNLIKSINNWYKENGGTTPIVQAANGEWQLADGISRDTIDEIENAVATNTFGLSEEEQIQMLVDLGVAEKAAELSQKNWEAMVRAANLPTAWHK